MQILSELTKLRQALLWSVFGWKIIRKTDMCMETDRKCSRSRTQDPFCSHSLQSMLDRLTERLKKWRYWHIFWPVLVNKEKRMQMVDSFINDDVPYSKQKQVEPINLLVDIVIHYDPWWNSRYRTRRQTVITTGQENVDSIQTCGRGNHEEKIIDIQERKELAEQVPRVKEWILAKFHQGRNSWAVWMIGR